MKRYVAAAVITAAVAVGLLDPSAAGSANDRQVPSRPIPKAERARLQAVAHKALALLPTPRGYVLDPESNQFGADENASWDEAHATCSLPARPDCGNSGCCTEGGTPLFNGQIDAA